MPRRVRRVGRLDLTATAEWDEIVSRAWGVVSTAENRRTRRLRSPCLSGQPAAYQVATNGPDQFVTGLSGPADSRLIRRSRSG